MSSAKPITLVQIPEEEYEGTDTPQPFVVVGLIPGTALDLGEIDGIQGIQGVKGDTGSEGPPGTPGQDGAAGAPGLPGERGIQGIQGNAGEQGEQGPRGLQGAQGAPGVRGIQGVAGEPGVNGTQGIQGERGLQGEAGASGIPAPGQVGEKLAFSGISNKTQPKDHTVGTLRVRVQSGSANSPYMVAFSISGSKVIDVGSVATSATTGTATTRALKDQTISTTVSQIVMGNGAYGSGMVRVLATGEAWAFTMLAPSPAGADDPTNYIFTAERVG